MASVAAPRGHLPLGGRRPRTPLRPHPSSPHAPPVVGERLARKGLRPGRYLSSRRGWTAGVAPGRREMPAPPSPLLCRGKKGETPLNTRGRRGSATRKQRGQPIRRRRASDATGGTDVSPPQTRGLGGRPIKMATATGGGSGGGGGGGGGGALCAGRGRENRRVSARAHYWVHAGSRHFAPCQALARAVSTCLDVRRFSLSVMALKVAAVIGGAAKAVLRPALLCRPWEVRRGSGPRGQPQRSLGRAEGGWLAERLGARLAVGPVRGGVRATRRS